MSRNITIKMLYTVVLVIVLSGIVHSATMPFVDNSVLLENSKGVVKFDPSAEFLNSTVQHWRCDFDLVPSTVEFGECFCIDTLPGLERLGGDSDSVGYGDLAECLNKTEGWGDVRTSGSSLPLVSASVDVYAEYEKIDNPLGTVTINSPSGTNVTKKSILTCDSTENRYRIAYTFFKNSPEFGLIATSYDNKLDLSEVPSVVLNSGDEIKCRALYRNGSQVVGVADSTNSIVIDDTSVYATSIRLAPAYPEVNDEIYCYGANTYDITQATMDSEGLLINHKIDFYVNNVLTNTTVMNDSDDSPALFVASLSAQGAGVARGDTVYCNYSVNLIRSADASVISTTSLKSEASTVVNTKPTTSSIYLEILVTAQKRFGNDVIRVYNNDATLVAAVTDTGMINLEGNLIDNHGLCGASVFDIVFDGKTIAFFDVNGNYCGYETDRQNNCERGLVNVYDDFNKRVASVDTLGILCYTGYFVEGGIVPDN